MDKKRQDGKTQSDREQHDSRSRFKGWDGQERRESAGVWNNRDNWENRDNRDRQDNRDHRDERNNRDNRDRRTEEADGMIEGRNAVIEALRAGVRLDKVYIQRSGDEQNERTDGRNVGGDHALGFIASTARAAGAVVVDADRRKLDAMSRTHAHQGVIALASVREYVPVEDILALAAERGEPPLLVVCDGITDPGNLGAILRSAECAGAHGVVLPKRRSAGLTAIVAKTSAGAVVHIPVARVSNLPFLLKELKKEGVWVYGAAAEGASSLYGTDFKVPSAIVIGSEGEGLSRLVRETCDALVSIPLRGKVGSLNASAAAAVLLYEAVRQRSGENG